MNYSFSFVFDMESTQKSVCFSIIMKYNNRKDRQSAKQLNLLHKETIH